MKEIDHSTFVKKYTHIRKQQLPLFDDWNLYKLNPSGTKKLVKELHFDSEGDMLDLLDTMIRCPLYHTSPVPSVIAFEGYVRREDKLRTGSVFVLFCIFEHFQFSLDKLIAQKIKDSLTFSVTEIFKLTKKVVKLVKELELAEAIHGDIRPANIAVMKDGSLKLIWAPFALSPIRMMQRKPYILRATNPAPEIIETYL